MEREQLEVDILVVGAGPAGLAFSLHFDRLINEHNSAVRSGERSGQPIEPQLLVIEKGKEVGSHALSGAVIDPSALSELLEGTEDEEPPWQSPVTRDAMYYLTDKRSFRLPWVPPALRQEGCYVASLGEFVRWLAGLCEKRGVEVYPGFPAVELLSEGDRVAGVRIGDSGIGRDGKEKSNFQPGLEVRSRLTVLAEGVRGTLSGQLIKRFGLDEGKQPQIYAVGVKELWQSPRPVQPGIVYHTLGFPLGPRDFGGGFLYSLGGQQIAVGLVVGLDGPRPATDSHQLLQRWKTHPLVRGFLEGGKLLSYGAKAIPEGGIFAMPRLFCNGAMILGDSAGFLNAQRLKGVHLAIKSGTLAAETAYEALIAGGFEGPALGGFQDRFEASWAGEELWKVRNFRQSFQGGFWRGLVHSGLQYATGGRGLKDPFPIKGTIESYQSDSSSTLLSEDSRTEFDGKLTFDKLTSVFHSDTAHEEDQPSHLKILDPSVCDTRCTEEWGNPCRQFCPADVYEIVQNAAKDRLRVNFSNCVHCKTCEVADPYQIIRWTPPEGGGGPDWKRM